MSGTLHDNEIVSKIDLINLTLMKFSVLTHKIIGYIISNDSSIILK